MPEAFDVEVCECCRGASEEGMEVSWLCDDCSRVVCEGCWVPISSKCWRCHDLRREVDGGDYESQQF